ncbi:MAG TPA: NAD(P)H-dependent oxidoreductase [Pseudomonadales bacterium]|nr:NAD(P)H-dependent oxidoreductase [Pseudomonadales bacterium]
MKHLFIYSSLQGANSASSSLLKQHAKRISGHVVERDLAAMALPHLSAEEMAAWSTPAEVRTLQQAQLAALSDTFIQDLRDADRIFIGLPMYNFGIPSVFKAWIDRVARAGETFRYTSEGPEGLLKGKKVTVVTTRGGEYRDTAMDVQSQYIRLVLGFIGLDDIEIIYAEGLAMGKADAAIAEADQALAKQLAA